ncbi:probable phospholipid-transporting ATPase IF [Clonorchis sinensis]|uniref:Phospholipid-transporting ATPase n=1 Tax=Clonorchis sinensis TaxID=79923 RepID=G7YKD9_CLOSI|nr:probable phospholipid-transporting ATPase IF [Clonorchis sinensis]
MLSFRPHKTKPTNRHIYANGLKSVAPVQYERSTGYDSNRIITSRYTWWNFVPLNLYEQFHQVPNFIFFCITFLFIFASGATSIFALVVPLAVSMSITMIKDAVYDIFRHIQDRRVNNKRFKILMFDIAGKRAYWSERRSSSLRVGQIVRCIPNQEVPCDIVLLCSSEPNREARLTTANLDGEVSVKTHYALAKTHSVYSIVAAEYPQQLRFDDVKQFAYLITEIDYEAPNTDLNKFEGNLVMPSKESPGSHLNYPISAENILLRGTKLISTNYVLGLVVYTGDDTKLSMNSKKCTRKYSSREERLNLVLALFFLAAIILCVLFTVASTLWNSYHETFPWFIVSSNPTRFSTVRMVFSFAFIINYLLPISLIITTEVQMVVNSYLITNDPQLFDCERRIGASANSVNTADELGQVQFLFSDKTGTLTQNDMLLRVCSLLHNDSTFLVEDANVYQLVRNIQSVPDSTGQPRNPAAGRLINMAAESNLQNVNEMPQTLKTFLTTMALCHTAQVKKEKTSAGFTYQANSPDEKALVDAASKLGISLKSVTPDPHYESARRLAFQINWGQSHTDVTTQEFIVDATLEFDHTRRRMTVMVRHPDGTFHIHSKGAESSMLEPNLCSRTSSEIRTKALERVNEIALAGLRTLVFATKQLSQDEYQQLLDERRMALSRFGEARREALRASTERIESGLELLAVTGIEDKLQIGVKECLENLRAAGIQVWVLTGDKEETAITVSQSAGHFPESMTIVRITGCTDFTSVAELVFKHLQGLDARYEQARLNQFGLVIDGASLVHALHPSLRAAFLDLCMNVTTVLCCRMSPMQKASMVELVHMGFGEMQRPVTAAIGDGGNDVSMILQANVGIGIYGKEGKEAARAADYVLPQFRFLQNLLLVHGHWAYHRISHTMLLFYFKCVAFVTTSILLAFYSGFSANAWYSSVVFGLYNLTLTSLVYMLFGMFERHLTYDQLLENPKLYRTISRNANLHFRRIILFVLDGVWHGSVIFFSVYFFLAGGGYFGNAVFIDNKGAHGNHFDFTLCGGAAMVYVVVCVNLRVLLQSRDHNLPMFIGFLITLVPNVAFFMAIQFKVSPSSSDYLTYLKLTLSPAFWLSFPVILITASLPVLIWRIKSDSWWQSHMSAGKKRKKHARTSILSTVLNDPPKSDSDPPNHINKEANRAGQNEHVASDITTISEDTYKIMGNIAFKPTNRVALNASGGKLQLIGCLQNLKVYRKNFRKIIRDVLHQDASCFISQVCWYRNMIYGHYSLLRRSLKTLRQHKTGFLLLGTLRMSDEPQEVQDRT